eukprot:CAMPEP_0114672790 /NCGR_PEP_ID=MMETSP0191-20121206/43501_1 /TAXON_ID=126664 /ORGANISM="Sorites sp." /LENGTH=240 /DNA_ID=CAMNT_0001935967 /DNA_START=355 /DNA_END=1074 /DNA_ORIENTATION=+
MAASTATDALDAYIIPIVANAEAKRATGQRMENKELDNYDIIGVADLYQQAGCLFKYAYQQYSTLAENAQQPIEERDPYLPIFYQYSSAKYAEKAASMYNKAAKQFGLMHSYTFQQHMLSMANDEITSAKKKLKYIDTPEVRAYVREASKNDYQKWGEINAFLLTSEALLQKEYTMEELNQEQNTNEVKILTGADANRFCNMGESQGQFCAPENCLQRPNGEYVVPKLIWEQWQNQPQKC